jgi:chromosome segregation ATPase
MRDRVEQVKITCTTEIRSAVENLEKKFKSLSTSTQDNQTDLQQQLDRVSKKLSSNLTELDETIDQKTTSLRQDLSQTRDSLQGDISSLRDLILEELERRFSQLKESKVSRDDIAEALFEMGMRLKGTEFIPTLKEAAEKHQPHDPVPLLETRKSTEHEGT